MSSIFQQYCDVTQSMAFKQNEFNQDSEYNNLNSESNNNHLLKCFICHGLDNGEQNFCIHCGGTNYVADSHPLALLLNQVIQRKLGKIEAPRQTLWNDFQDVQAIRQEEEQLDQRKIICDICGIQCDMNYRYYCQSCQCFYVCDKCAQIKGDQIDHEHPLTTNKNISFLGLRRMESKDLNSNKNSTTDQECCNFQKNRDNSKRFINLSENTSQIIERQADEMPEIRQNSNKQHFSRLLDSVQIQIGQSFDFIPGQQSGQIRQSFGFAYCNYQEQICNNCASELKEIYSVCRTCEKQLKSYKVCHQCFDKDNYQHDHTHKLQPTLGNLLGKKSQFHSNQMSPYFEEDDLFYNPKLIKKSSSYSQIPHKDQIVPTPSSAKKAFNKFQYIQSFGASLQLKKTQKKQKRINFQTQSRARQQRITQQRETQQRQTQQRQTQQRQTQQRQTQQRISQSRVKVDCGSSLYSSSQLNNDYGPIGLVHRNSSSYEVNNSLQNMPRYQQEPTQKLSLPLIETDQQDQDILLFFANQDVESQQDIPVLSRNHNKKVKINPSKRVNSPNGYDFSRNQDKKTISSCQVVEIESNQNMTYTQTRIQQRQFQSCILENSKKQNKTDSKKDEFLFYQHTCDQCGCYPIKNVRYHCLDCEDFDICANCFSPYLKWKHRHQFQKIDGLKKMQDQKAMMLQRKDINKGRDNLLKSTNINMLVKSKKTIELIKLGVGQLNGSVANLAKSVSSSIQFSSQRLTFKGKLKYF